MKCGNLANEKGVLFDKQNGVKIGSIEIFARSDSAPPGYLICDGAEISREVYKELFDVIGTTWGSGDGTTTFNLPNLIGKTIWGGHLAEVGAYKSAGVPDIIGQFRAIRLQETIDDTISGAFGFNGWGGSYMQAAYAQTSRECATNFKASRWSGVYGASSTVQPPAAVLCPCIRYEIS